MITVIDYGMGNLRSVSKALEHLGAEVKVSSSVQDLLAADKVVLPGVGAFGDAVDELHQRKLFEPIQSIIASKKPFLGICLGLQLLFSESEESPEKKGLGIYPGTVSEFSSRTAKVPHMGWNQVQKAKEHPVLGHVFDDCYFYFVHSYYAPCDAACYTAGQCNYGERDFTAILADENVIATQFHPEKSQCAGLEILKRFVEWKT